MKTLNTIAGNLYTVTSPNGCTVTDERGKLKKTVKAGDQLTIMAPGAELRVDDDEADIRASNFKGASAAASSAEAAADAASQAAAEAAKAAEDATGILENAAGLSKDNSFTGNNDHSGTESFNGNIALNGNTAESSGWLALCSGAIRILLKNFTIADYQSIWKKMYVDFPEDVTMPSYNITSAYGLFRDSKIKTAPAWVFETVTKGEHVFTNSLVEKLPDVFMFPNITIATKLGTHGMFHNCDNLLEIPVAWTFDKLKYGSEFASFSKNLRRAHGLNLCNLTEGNNFMYGTQVDKITALRVLTTIPDRNTAALDFSDSSGLLVLGIHKDFRTDDEVLEAINAAEEKGWRLTVQWNGTAGEYATAGASTFAMREPVYAKPGVPYEDGTQSLDWGHYVTDTSGYMEFDSLEEAKEYFNITD